MNELPKDAIKCPLQRFCPLVDSMGGDDAIVQSARVSYGKGRARCHKTAVLLDI
ncbi:MAG: hypothetical protein Ct9H90mP20_3190 [Candidatus Neomarinimicrobiota bacterium]|nr:MAG: hypothetical protein Ct9H90mP20_3190 [Candidatus Neomarinimicrobiota bacterium]